MTVWTPDICAEQHWAMFADVSDACCHLSRTASCDLLPHPIKFFRWPKLILQMGGFHAPGWVYGWLHNAPISNLPFFTKKYRSASRDIRKKLRRVRPVSWKLTIAVIASVCENFPFKDSLLKMSCVRMNILSMVLCVVKYLYLINWNACPIPSNLHDGGAVSLPSTVSWWCETSNISNNLKTGFRKMWRRREASQRRDEWDSKRRQEIGRRRKRCGGKAEKSETEFRPCQCRLPGQVGQKEGLRGKGTVTPVLCKTSFLMKTTEFCWWLPTCVHCSHIRW